MRVEGSGFGVEGSGFRVQGSGFRVAVGGSGFRVQGSGFRVQGSGFRVEGKPEGFAVPHAVVVLTTRLLVQGYLTHKNHPPPRSLRSYGGPGGRGFFL